MISLPSLACPPTPEGSRCAWLTWAAASAAALVFTAVLGSNVPYWDDWEYVPVLTGHQPLTWGFLWSQHNEHRIPLPRLVYIAAFKLSGGDLRAGMLVDVLMLSLAAALLMRVAARWRGHGSAADGALALALLHPGHVDNLIWTFDVVFVIPALLLSLALATIVGLASVPGRREVLTIAGVGLLLPLCGAPGLVHATALGGWLLLQGVVTRAARDERRASARALPLALGGAVAAVCALYLWRFHRPPAQPEPGGLRSSLVAAGQFLSLSLGPAAGWHWAPVAVALSLATLLTAGAVVRWWWRSSSNRPAAEGLLALAAGQLGLALAVGWGRSGSDAGAGLAPRYVTLSVPLLCWLYVAWCRLPWPRVARVAHVATLLATLWLYPANLAFGMEFGHARRKVLQALVEDLDAGMPLERVVERHGSDVYPSWAPLTQWLRMLRDDRLGPFSPADKIARFHRLYPFFHAPLVDVRQGMLSVRVEEVEGRPALVVHAEGDLVLDVRPGMTRASGSFGLLREPFSRTRPGDPPYDGTHFVARFRSDEGIETELFAKTLNPLRNPGDYGRQVFSVSLPGGGGRLFLGTRFGIPGTNSNGYNDWGYWTGVEIR
jgi:hypothetical protein